MINIKAVFLKMPANVIHVIRDHNRKKRIHIRLRNKLAYLNKATIKYLPNI